MVVGIITCRRCGRCCHYMKNGKLKACKYLIKFNNKTSCRIYKQKNRIGKVIDVNENGQIMCLPRVMDNRNFLNCPYNKIIQK